MQNLNKKLKVALVCFALSMLTIVGTMTAPNSTARTVAGDGQETHGGKGGRALRLIAGDGQETHGGKGTKTA